MLDTTKIILVTDEKNLAVISIEPLEKGYGHTLGNSLRRVLLTSLIGASITKVHIKGAPHQFMTIAGMPEDIVDLLLNVKKIRVKLHGDEPVTLKLSVKGPMEVTAGSITTHPSVEIANPELILSHLSDSKSVLDMELVVEKGIGYMTADERIAMDPTYTQKLGEILLDAHYSPIVRVNYSVDTTRVGRITNFDKLNMEITTDGTLTPMDAMRQSSEILTKYFTFLSGAEANEYDEKSNERPKVMAKTDDTMTVDELDLPPKIANRLKENGYETVDDVINAGRDQLLKMPNFGEKSLKEVDAKLKEKGYSIVK
ncbi:MAG: DNA-directed RNA polymerase subunit alpha [bacterium]|nr:DNA-directed RNA polymerase subunit alpha [bacterium]